MARSLLVGLALCGLVMFASSAEAGLRRGCKGGSCGVSYGGCANGSCSVPVYDKAPVQAPGKVSPSDVPAAPAPAPSAQTETNQPAVAAASAPAATVSVNSTRTYRSGRLFARRAR